MKIQLIKSVLFNAPVLAALIAVIATSTSCMTTYDAAGRPVQSVDPGVAVAGVAAAGVLGYALANDNNHHYHNNSYYYRRPPHRHYRY